MNDGARFIAKSADLEIVKHDDLLKPIHRIYQNPNGYVSYRVPVDALEEAISARCQRELMQALIAASKGYEVRIAGRPKRTDDLKFAVEQYVLGAACSLNDWPIWWVGAEILPAAMASDVPDEVLIEDIHWPRDAMVFMIPRGAWRSGDGHYEFIALARMTDALREVEEEIATRTQTPKMLSGYRDFLLCYAYHSAGFVSVSTYKMFGSLNSIALRSKDALELDRESYEVSGIPFDDAANIVSSIIKTALNLMLIMQARPELLTGGEFVKRVKAKASDSPRALWQPRWIGRDYKIAREPQGGTHASPRLHWRRGSWRRQPYGPKSSLRKMIWIEPMLIGAKPKDGQQEKATNQSPAPTTGAGETEVRKDGGSRSLTPAPERPKDSSASSLTESRIA